MKLKRDEQHKSDLGVEAANVLQNPAYLAAMQGLREQINLTWRNCKVRDTQGQQLLLQMAKLCDNFEGLLFGMVQGGRLADRAIEDAVNGARGESALRRAVRRVV